MGINKVFIYIIAGLVLSGCAQSTAMLGPAITLASTGNVSQAGITYITNKAVKKETGMDTLSLVSNKIETKCTQEDSNYKVTLMLIKKRVRRLQII